MGADDLDFDSDDVGLKPLEEEGTATDEVVTLSDTVHWPMLDLAANPDVYRLNAYRVTQRPVPGTAVPGKLLVCGPPAGVPIVQEAQQRLAHPERQALEEFFWFWSPETDGHSRDQALDRLARGDINAALQLWQERKDAAGRDRIVALHNLAVLYHHLALDLEHRALSTALDASQLRTRETCWRSAWEAWKEFFEVTESWEDRLEKLRAPVILHVRQASQPQVISALIQALCHINIHLALRFVTAEQPREMKRQLDNVRAAEWPDWFYDDTVRFLIDELKRRIDGLNTTCRDSAKAHPEHADRAALGLKAGAKPFLLVVNQLLPEKSVVRRQIHDSIALQMLDCVERFGLATQNWKEALRTLTRVHRQGITEAMSARLDRSLSDVQEKARTIAGWCTYGYFDLPSRALAVLEGAERDAQSKHYDYVIAALEKLLAAWKSLAPQADPLLARRPLAYCLDRRAIPRLQAAWKDACDPLPIFEEADPEALQHGIDRAQDMFAPGRYRCSVCGAAIFEDRFVKIRHEEHRVMLCLRCGEEGRKQQAKKARRLHEELMSVRDDLLKAQKLDPQNQDIVDHLLKTEQAMQLLE
jgi:hypothetical protein